MPIHAGPLLSPADLQPGDIIIDYEDEPDHSLMWVGGDKPVLHCADSSTTSGVVQQSNRVYGGDGDDPIAEVYRCNSGAMAARAAIIARRFATRTDDPAYIAAKQQGGMSPLRTRFSQNRLGGNGGLWGPEAFVRAVRAYYRAAATQVLSANEGVTCSQFITYTYQAAGVWGFAQHNAAARDLIDDVAQDGLLGNLHLHGLSPMEGMCNVSRSYTRLRPIRGYVEGAIAGAMQVNACITAVDVLTTRMRGGGGFAHLGNLSGDDD